MSKQRMCFVVESGTDVRLVDELAQRYALTVLARGLPRGSPISQSPLQSMTIELGPVSRVLFAWRVWRRLTSVPGFDIVLVQGYALAAIAANLAVRVHRAKAYMLVCSPVELYYRCRSKSRLPGKRFSRWEYAGLKALSRINARLGRHYVVLSRHLADLVRSHGARCPIDIVPVYGVDLCVFHPATEHLGVIRKRMQLPSNGSLVFFSSRIAPEKDSETLLQAFQMLLAEGRRVWLLHRSGGYQLLLEQAKRFGVIDHVIATDARHPLNGLELDYQASDLCVQASREEGLGFSPLEALACGVPVVAAAVGGLRETIVDGETGWTYPVGDAASLARCIAAVLDDPEEGRRRAARGRQLVLERFEQRRVFDRLEAVLGEGP